MAFKLVHAKYDRETDRAYVELRDEDDDGGEILAVTIFSFRTTARLSKQQIEQDIVRQGAPHSEARRRTYLIFGAAGAITSDQPGHCAAPVAGRDVRHRG